MNETIKAERSNGQGLAKQIGFPTINIWRTSSNCGVYIVNEKDYGLGVAFIMPKSTEIHFFKDVDSFKKELEYTIKSEVECFPDSILDFFYKGLQYENFFNKYQNQTETIEGKEVFKKI